MIKQRPSSCAHLLSPFQSANLLPSLSVAVKYLFLLLPEILFFYIRDDMSVEVHLKNVCRSVYSNFAVLAQFGIFFQLTLQKHLCPLLSSLGLIIVTRSSQAALGHLLEKLGKVQNSAARLVLKTHKRDHVSPLLRTLHWLPIQARIEYKLSTLCHSFFSDTAPVYLSDLRVYSPSRQLRSSSD